MSEAREGAEPADARLAPQDSATDPPVERMVRRQAVATPHAIAIRDQHGFLTYRELMRAVDRWARHLHHVHGVSAGQPVTILADRSRWTIIGVLSLWRLGAVYVPVDPDYPWARIAHVLSDSGSHILLKCPDAPLRGAPSSSVMVIDIDGSLADSIAPLPSMAAETRDPAYIIYTSGSTGQPKGVVVAHAALSNVIIDHADGFGITTSDRVLLFSSPAFDAALFQILMPLVKGASVVLARREVVSDPDAFTAHVHAQGVTVLSLPPAFLNRLNRAVFPSVRSINTGGDAPIVADALHYAKQCAFHCTYGPTEATICVARHRVDPDATYPHGIPLGEPVRNTTLHLLDERLSPVQQGQIGEICIAGPGLALGYHGRPDLTRDCFVTNGNGLRLYRTGDLARWWDGELIFAGRRDQQIKIRGYRVELGEIEHALEAHVAVRQAVVISRPGSAGSPQLVAYLVGDSNFGRLELSRHLLARLPAYMVPSHFLWLAALPTNVQGKIDVAALPPVRERSTASGSMADAAQARIAEVWQSVLGGQAMDGDSDFFALGGDSLKAAAAVAQLRRKTGIDVRIEDIFLGPTPRTCAELLAGRGRVAETGIVPLPPADSYPLSHGQRRLWLLHQIDGQTAVYNLAYSYRIEGNLDVDSLIASLRALIARHEILRTAFVLEGSEPRQRVMPAERVAIELIDLQAAPDADAEAEKIAAATSGEPFDIADAPPLRLRLLQLPENATLLLTVHHILADGWSIGQFLRELSVFYAAGEGERTAALATPRIQYRDFAAWEAGHLALTGGVGRDFWLAQLADAPEPLELPTDLPRPLQRRHEGGFTEFVLPDAVMAALDTLCLGHGVSRFMLLLAIVKVLLHRYSGQSDIIVGVPVADRPAMELFDQVGMYVNTLALRSHIDPSAPFADFLRGVRQACLDGYAHRSYPFDRVVGDLGIPRDPARTPLFDVMVALQRDEDLRLELGDLRVTRRPDRPNGSKFDLSFDFVERDGRMIVQVEYDSALFKPARIERMGRHFGELACAIATDPGRVIGRLPLLPDEEARAISLAFHRPPLAVASATPLDLFDAAAQATPDAVAVRFRDRAVNYADLTRLAAALAAVIRGATTTGDSPMIGVLLERSELVPAAILAAWATGGAYLPLDPELPPARMAMILHHSGCTVVVTQGELRERLADLPVRAVLIDDLQPLAGPPPRLTPPAYRTDTAYCFYTSGSTGAPRGVTIGRNSVVNAVAMWRRDYRLERPVVLQLASFAFDVSMGDICRSILVGGTLVVADAVERIDPAGIIVLLERHGVDMMETTPVIARLLTAYLACAGPPTRAPALVVVGSDSWNMGEFRALRAVLPTETRLVSSYGTTEATIDSTFFEPSEASAGLPDGIRVPLGRPMSNVEALILDGNSQLVPIGVTGELCLAGPGVGLGYLGDAALTAARFVPHPNRPGDVMFRTGDRAAWSESGDISFLGRLDDQLKLRGNRIDRIEIETVLERHPEVGKAIAMVHADDTGRERLVAYVTAAATIDEQALRGFVSHFLPPYAVPDDIVRLERIPVSSNSKVDVKALKALTLPMATRTARGIARTPSERLLDSIWRAVLGIDHYIDINDSFYALGGDSIRAIGVIVRLKQQGISLSPADLFRNTTIARLAAHIDTDHVGAGLAPAPLHLAVSPQDLPDRGGAEDAYPATAMQIAMLDWAARAPNDQCIYHGQFGWQARHSDLSAARLVAAIRWTLHRHPALRTGFRRDGEGGLHQLVLPVDSVQIDIVDLGMLEPAAQEDAIERALAADRNAPFHVGRTDGPFSRVQIFLRDAGTAEILMILHHAIDDGWGFGTVERDIIAAYDGLAGPGAPSPATPDPSCRQFVALEREAVADTGLRAFWRAQAPRLRPVTTQGAHFRPVVPPAFAVTKRRICDRATAIARRRAEAVGVSMKSICLAAHLRMLDWLCQGEPVAIGLVTNNRSARLDNPLEAVGLFWNILPFMLTTPVPAPGEIQRRLDGMEPKSAYPLCHILAEWGDPELDFCFNYIHFHNRSLVRETDGLTLRPTRTRGNFHFALTCTFSVDPGDGALDLILNHDVHRFDQPLVNEIAARIEEGLTL